MIKAVELRKGKTVMYEGEICVIHEIAHVAKGNKRSYMQAKVKQLKSGTIRNVRFSVDDRLEVPYIESKEYEYLYKDGDDFIVMDLETFDQFPIAKEFLAESEKWLKPNIKLKCAIHEGNVISVDLPVMVDLTIAETTPAIKGATATNQLKEATLETGARIRVPPFIENGEVVRVDTRTGEYMERAK
ncbi:MAG: elongation factor P [Planctomycetes bacterium]|nr:elongation factor P [Planctomycetota bacterium]